VTNKDEKDTAKDIKELLVEIDNIIDPKRICE